MTNNDFKDINTIIASLKANKRACIQLRRNFGKLPYELDLATRLAFYQVTDGTQYMRQLNNLNYFIASLVAFQNATYGNSNMENYLHSKYKAKNCSKSMQRQIEKIVSNPLENDGRVLIWMSKFIKMAIKKDLVTINAGYLYSNLKNWNENNGMIPEIWAKKIVAEDREKEN